jgi:hypothetical protein
MIDQLKFVLVASLFATALATSVAVAAPAGSGDVLVVTPKFSVAAGNITFTGTAVDCTTGQPAMRVAVYDGNRPDAPYVADVSMDTKQALDQSCVGRSGAAPVGFTLILNSRTLKDGDHALQFVAEYPDGSSATSVLDVLVQNTPLYIASDE